MRVDQVEMTGDPEQDQVSDGGLLRRIASGDAGAFTALFRRRRREVFRFALQMTASAHVAEDVTQEVFLIVMREAGRYDGRGADARAWLCGIARNLVWRRLHHDRRLDALDEDEDRPCPASLQEDALGGLIRSERIDMLRRAVATLPVRYREAVVLCDLHELSYAEAAEALGCAVGTVRSRLHRGRSLLGAKLTASAPDAADTPATDVPRDKPAGAKAPGEEGSNGDLAPGGCLA